MVSCLSSRDTRLDHQRKENALATALRTQVLWTTYGTILNPFKRYLSIRPLVLWYNSRRMESYIKVLIDKRFSKIKMEQQLDTGSKRSKSVLSLILQTYLKDNIDKTEVTLDSDFRDITAAQLRLFLFPASIVIHNTGQTQSRSSPTAGWLSRGIRCILLTRLRGGRSVRAPATVLGRHWL